MIRFLHSADWQLGARFTQFGPRAHKLREARLQTFRRTLQLATQRGADAFLIAGDLFEDNWVESALVEQVAEFLREVAPLPIYVLPGNHDPISGPDAVWHHKALTQGLSHVHIFQKPEAVSIGGLATLAASPLTQKRSLVDPSGIFSQLLRSDPEGKIRIGMTHGSPAIDGKHQADDHPIALNAASRVGLDYLALGHWHGWLSDLDGGRMVMPGTPEPDRFDSDSSGKVAWVEIDAAGTRPRVVPIPVHSLQWRTEVFDFLDVDGARTQLARNLGGLQADAARSIVRVQLQGSASPASLLEQRAWMEPLLTPYFASQILERTQVSLTASELRDLMSRHGIVAQVLADIDQLERFATGSAPALTPIPSPAESLPGDSPTGLQPITLPEAQAMLTSRKLELSRLDGPFFATLRRTLLQSLQEVSK